MELEECIPNCQSVENQIEADELGKMISEWLRGLSQVDRVIFIQRYFEGVMVKQIASFVSMEPKKVSKKLFSLRKQLKDALEKEGIVL